ncbi:MAG: Hsp20/alpha crystallin family protein [Thermoguttaceae bacterium]|jgi:HSP20 family protein
MSLIPWRNKLHGGAPSESTPLSTLRNEMDRLFDSFVREPFGMLDWPAFMGGEKWWPAVDVAEMDKEVTVRAEIPGIDPKELDVTVTGNQLVVSGEKKESTEKKDKGFYHNEARYGSFRRVIPLPEGVDSEHVDAQYANGVLTLTLQKTPAAAAKKIEIKVKE